MQTGIRQAIETLLSNSPPATDRAHVLADLARNLADRLDGGCEDRYAAGVAKELRVTVDELESVGGQNDAFDLLAQRLSTKVGDLED